MRPTDTDRLVAGAALASEIVSDSRWIGNHGIGRFAREVLNRLPSVARFEARRRPWHPLDPLLLGTALRRMRPKLFFSPGYNSPIGWAHPFVFTLHDLNHLCVHENSNSAKRAYYRYVIRPACHRAAFVLTVSEYSRCEIEQWAGVPAGKVINVGNGVGLPFTPSGTGYDPGFPYLLYVGSRKPHKNLPRLLQAFAASGVAREVHLVLTGMADAQICAEIGRLGLAGAVGFVQCSKDEELARLYRGALALVFPSLYEGFGLPPLEALACGVPVLTSNICSLPEVVGDAGVLVDPRDVESIADGITKLVRDQELRARLQIRGPLRAANFSWETTATRTLQILEIAA